jgi:hypothetical protein
MVDVCSKMGAIEIAIFYAGSRRLLWRSLRRKSKSTPTPSAGWVEGSPEKPDKRWNKK